MAAIVQWVYNKWVLIPAGVRAGIIAVVTVVVSIGLAFGWHFPTDWADAKAEIAAFWLVLAPAVVVVFQKALWPPLFQWILVLLGLGYTAEFGRHEPKLVGS